MRWEYFVDGPKNKIRTFCMSSDGFAKKIKNGVSACIYEITSTNCKNPFSNTLQEAYSGFQEPTCKLKKCPRAACDSEIFSQAGYGKIRPMTAKECQNINYAAAFGNKVNCNYKNFCTKLGGRGGGAGRGLASIFSKASKKGSRCLLQ
jgi:hypothetical protein